MQDGNWNCSISWPNCFEFYSAKFIKIVQRLIQIKFILKIIISHRRQIYYDITPNRKSVYK